MNHEGKEMKRVQFSVDDEFFDVIVRYARHMDRPVGNLALHALRQFIRRYKPFKGEEIEQDKT